MATLDHMIKCLTDVGLDTSKMDRISIINLYNQLQNDGIFNKYYSCERKDKYPTMNAATKASYNLEQIRPRSFEPYMCQWCGTYHVGGQKDRSMYQKYVRPEVKGTEFERRLKYWNNK